MMENIQLSDITIVANLQDTLFLCVKNGDVENAEAKAIQFDLAMDSYKIEDIQKFLKFTPYQQADLDSDSQDFYRDIIYRKMSSSKILEALIGFTE